jgi:hypothetical protein
LLEATVLPSDVMSIIKLLNAALLTIHQVELVDDVAVVRVAGVNIVHGAAEQLGLGLDDVRQGYLVDPEGRL